MVLGSSNELITCWRAFLWKKLQDANQKDFDLVGDVSDGPDCGVAGYDKDLRATSGTIVTNLTSEQFAGWFTAHPADAMLVHFGGADLLQNLPIPGIVAGYDRMLAEARKVEPTVRILMAQHTPQDSASCDDCLNTVPALNAEITKWATANTQPTSPILVVDLFTGVDPATDTSDGVHLNEAGSAKVADRFYEKLSPFFAK
jgi:lysophospholipase L1-like esterase